MIFKSQVELCSASGGTELGPGGMLDGRKHGSNHKLVFLLTIPIAIEIVLGWTLYLVLWKA
jgi:hypothetical protein